MVLFVDYLTYNLRIFFWKIMGKGDSNNNVFFVSFSHMI